jgi:DNA-binding phage protein
MNNVKVPTNNNYRDYLIKSLRDPEEAAAYLEAILEEQNPEPELLKAALLDVAEALGNTHISPDQSQFHHNKLDEILSQTGSNAVYSLSEWLNDLGLKLTVTVADQEQE